MFQPPGLRKGGPGNELLVVVFESQPSMVQDKNGGGLESASTENFRFNHLLDDAPKNGNNSEKGKSKGSLLTMDLRRKGQRRVFPFGTQKLSGKAQAKCRGGGFQAVR